MVNALVRGTGEPGSGVRISLENPIGLYIQQPSFDTYELPFNAPPDAQPSDYWKIVRGRKRQDGEDMDYILHAVFEVPEDQGFTVGDITINGFNIEYGSQIAQTFEIALAGLPLPQLTPPESFLCAGNSQNPLPRPSVLRDLNMVGVAGRSSLNMRIEQGTTVENVVLVASSSDRNATIEFTDAPGITVETIDFQEQDQQQYFILTITAAPDAPLGNRSLLLTNPDGSRGPAVFGMLEVVPPGTLARTQAPTAQSLVESQPVKLPTSIKLPTRR